MILAFFFPFPYFVSLFLNWQFQFLLLLFQNENPPSTWTTDEPHAHWYHSISNNICWKFLPHWKIYFWKREGIQQTTKLPNLIKTKLMQLHGLCPGRLSHQHSPEVALLEDVSDPHLSVCVCYWLATSPSFSPSTFHMFNRCY